MMAEVDIKGEKIKKQDAKALAMLAVVRVRGTIGPLEKVEDTMRMLYLYRKHYCVIVPSTPDYLGMLQKIKDYVTFGEINEATLVGLLRKRGKLAGSKPLPVGYVKQKTGMTEDVFAKAVLEFKAKLRDVAGLKLFFRLNPPVKGFERGGIKKPFSIGGVLGYRGAKINELIKRML